MITAERYPAPTGRYLTTRDHWRKYARLLAD